MSDASLSSTVRVVTYNVLSSSLCSPFFFNRVNQAYCAFDYRYERVVEQLITEIKKQAVICLQEVSLLWVSKLVFFFESNHYTCVTSNYGIRNNGYMGICIAYPRNRYQLKASDVFCVTDTKVGGWKDPSAKKDTTQPGRWTRMWLSLLSWLNLSPKREKESLWDTAKSRNNTVICLRLANNTKEFMVATYHMPCIFWEPAVMSIHITMAIQAIQRLATKANVPYIVAGDFNFKPISACYQFVTTGIFPAFTNEPTDPEVHGKPTLPSTLVYPGDPFRFELTEQACLKSAYAENQGKEPAFTNYAWTEKMKETFADTLDYIFYGGEGDRLRVRSVKELSTREIQLLDSLPSATEGSDHLMIAAEFDLC